MDDGKQEQRQAEIADLRQSAAQSRDDGRRDDLDEVEKEAAIQIADRLDGEANVLEAAFAVSFPLKR